MLTLAAILLTAGGLQPPRMTLAQSTAFVRTWDVVLPDRVRLVDTVTVSRDGRQSLVTLSAQQRSDDPRRTVKVSHWDGFHFVTDYSVDFLGHETDVLLCGRFRDVTPPVTAAAGAPGAAAPSVKVAAPPPAAAKGRKGVDPEKWRQIVTESAVYEWDGDGYRRLCDGMPDLRLEIADPKAVWKAVSGHGDTASLVALTDSGLQTTGVDPPTDGSGWVGSGTGTQLFTDSSDDDFAPGVRFMQAVWDNRTRWFVCLRRGKPAPTPTDRYATTGDQLVVYVPTDDARDRPFWRMRRGDFVQAWVGEVIGGRVLDVRIGDPRSDGKPGIMVLTSESNDTVRRLIFYQGVTVRPFGLPPLQANQ